MYRHPRGPARLSFNDYDNKVAVNTPHSARRHRIGLPSAILVHFDLLKGRMERTEKLRTLKQCRLKVKLPVVPVLCFKLSTRLSYVWVYTGHGPMPIKIVTQQLFAFEACGFDAALAFRAFSLIAVWDGWKKQLGSCSTLLTGHSGLQRENSNYSLFLFPKRVSTDTRHTLWHTCIAD